MSAIKLLTCFLGIDPKFLSKKEKLLLEADLLIKICKEVKENFRHEYSDYFRLLNFSVEKEKIMLDTNYIRLAIKDILISEAYTLSGIAYYTDTPEEVVYKIAAGCNLRPSAIFLQRIIELHQEVKRDLYKSIEEKIVNQYFALNNECITR